MGFSIGQMPRLGICFLKFNSVNTYQCAYSKILHLRVLGLMDSIESNATWENLAVLIACKITTSTVMPFCLDKFHLARQ